MSLTDGADREARLETLLRAALELASEHDLDQILERMVRCAAEVADARYAALGIYDWTGRIERFVHYGMDADTVAEIGHLPQGRGLLGEVIAAEGPIRLPELQADPRSCGFPPHHPPMHSFLGVPVRLGSRRLGNLYLTERRDGQQFDETDEQLVATLATFAAAAVESALLVQAEHDRAVANARVETAEERSRAQSEMLARVIAAQEAERARVARDLHDQVGQALTSVLLALRLVTDALRREPPDPSGAAAQADEVRGLVADALQDVRQLAFELRPTVLDDVGLIPAIRRLATVVASRNDLAVDLDLNGLDDDSRLPSEVETVVYRVVQEALTNVTRHANAKTATILIIAKPTSIEAVIRDDGAGFDATASRDSLGLTGMSERATLLNGSVEVNSTLGAGTTVRLEVPIGP